MPQSPVLIGVAGGSGAGKSTLARRIAAALDASVLSLDFYYRDSAHLPLAERDARNFDHPDALEWPLLIGHVESLAAGRTVGAPVYDFATHTRLRETRRIEPRRAVIVEGILALHEPALRRAYRTSFFVDAPEEVRLGRRVDRDVRERGRRAAQIREQFERSVRPMHQRYVEPSREHAAAIADGESPFAPLVEELVRSLGADVARGPEPKYVKATL